MIKIKSQHWFLLAFLSCFVMIILKNAWVCDDSYITFRVVDNFVHGFGLRWNVTDRVQSYTNPLWLMLLTPFYYLTHEIYFTSIIISILFSFSALALLSWKLKANYSALFVGLTIFISSNSFVDFSTSGLENALSHFLFVTFMILFFNDRKDKLFFFLIFLNAGFIVLNRIDHLIIVLPFLISTFLRKDRSSFLGFMGFIPIIIWTVFSIIYYGFPFPNTAYAKLNTGIERYLVIKQGLLYVLDFIKNDYVGAAAVFAALIVSFPIKNRKGNWPLFSSIILYLVYIVWIGGDFMSGRFFTIMILVSVIVIIRQTFPVKYAWFFIPVIIASSVISPKSTILSWTNYSDRTINNLIADERGYYFKFTGLFNSKPLAEKPIDPFKNKGKKDGFLVIKDGVGFSGFNYGPKYRILDRYALGEPLLARIPYQMPHEQKRFRPGHLGRDFPEGYVETIKKGKNLLIDPDLKKYYEIIKTITGDNIFSFKRMIYVAKINAGVYDKLIKNYISRKVLEKEKKKTRAVPSLIKFKYEEREYSTKDSRGSNIVYHDMLGVVCEWEGSGFRERYLFDWISPQGRIVFSKYIYEERKPGSMWYPYLGKFPLSAGKWSIVIKRITYKDTGNDQDIGKIDFEI